MKKDDRTANDWSSGNAFELLENGEEYFPRLFTAIDQAEREIVVETYIWEDDEVGNDLGRRLVHAARRGVRVRVTIDGYGTPVFPAIVLGELASAGVQVYSFDSQPTWLRIRTNFFCRLHRKVAVVDRRIAFVGGINIWALHLRRFGGASMQDYAVRVEGPVVERIRDAIRTDLTMAKVRRRRPWRRWRRLFRRVSYESSRPGRDGLALFAVRDNVAHDTDIEALYRLGVRHARHSVVLANAYFFPGYRLLRDLTRAARRGVDVRLILQGKPDVLVAPIAASLLYGYLRAAGVRVYRYMERPLHAKVAVIDENWATVGSSNLDPISLGLNLEANLFVLDAEFAKSLRGSLETLIKNYCEEVATAAHRGGVFRRLLLLAIYHLTRGMPQWGRFILRRPQVAEVVDVSLDA